MNPSSYTGAAQAVLHLVTPTLFLSLPCGHSLPSASIPCLYLDCSWASGCRKSQQLVLFHWPFIDQCGLEWPSLSCRCNLSSLACHSGSISITVFAWHSTIPQAPPLPAHDASSESRDQLLFRQDSWQDLAQLLASAVLFPFLLLHKILSH